MNSIFMNDANENFNQKVDRWVCAAINNGVTNFNSLLNSLPGVYPSVVLDSLKRLAATEKISKRSFSIAQRRTNKSEHKKLPSIVDGKINMPVPHPLDYDWRFSEAASAYLLDRCLELTNSDETIAFLGTPSVYRQALINSFPRKLILLDNNVAVVNYFSQNFGDDAEAILFNAVTDPVANIKATLVIVDPPWYESDLLGFMWTAAKICCLNGHILISLPPVGTRPAIEADLTRFFNFTNKAGLKLIRDEKGILPYISPPFEMNALKMENFYNINEEWRRGDLAVFKKIKDISSQRPLNLHNLEGQWLEEIIEGVRIKLKPDDVAEFKDPKLLTIVKENIFSTVSRRDERRRLAEVWTSGNRVFACEGRFVLQKILQELASGKSAEEVLSEKLSRKLTKEEIILIQKSKLQLAEIINMERAENQIFADGNN